MAYDGMTMAAVAAELQALVGAKILRIYQPEAHTILLQLRQPDGSKYRLLASADATAARVHLTEHSYPNPAQPPMFCMLLRKHLEGGVVTAVTQPGLDRVLVLAVQAYDELHELCQRQLICEVMGKHSNIILVNPENGQIIDAIKRYSHAVSRYREVLPGSLYIPPPAQNKKDPRTITYEDLEAGLLQSLGQTAAKAVAGLLDGFSPLLGRELVFRAGLEEDLPVEAMGAYEFGRLYEALQDLLGELAARCPFPSLVQGEKGWQAFSAFRLTQFPAERLLHPSSVNETIDRYYRAHQELQAFQNLQHRLRQKAQKELERCYKKAALQQDTIRLAQEADTFRVKGEILTANLYRIKPGDRLVELENFYDPEGRTIAIELLPELSPADNAQRYFHLYNKAKNAAQKARQYYEETREEMAYLEGILHSVESADTMAELREIEEELVKQGYLREAAGPGKSSPARPEIPSFRSSDGFTILVGKNNKQNDYLTLRVARDQDLWLHTKDLPGSHVIIRNPEGKKIPETTLREAAHLAAYFSKGRFGSQVPVDYTQRKYVRKPSGAKPGMVLYENHQTIYVTPDPELVEKLKAAPAPS
ncbi:MAG TPA: fibronectin/fibrinogen-binding protein [Clostridia bacterium]|nr:fibronectin/fibrinogen-binding protein [Clostridia bacterium]